MEVKKIIGGVVLALSIYSSAKGASIDTVDLSKLPQPGEGVKIVSEDEMPKFKLPKEIQISVANEKKLGYVKRKSYDAEMLLDMGNNHFVSNKHDKFYLTNDPYDTHLKKSSSQIKLAFNYKPLSFVTEENTVGYGAAMTWKNGWTGITQFFKHEPIGVCSYLKTNVALNESSIRLSRERISYYINQKPAVAVNEGQEKEGFSYIVNWYDNDYFHRLSCANSNFSKVYAEEVQKLAILIDKES